MLEDLPVVTLEMRIQPVIQTMVRTMLVEDQNLKDEIYKSCQEAVVNFNWKKELDTVVKSTLHDEVSQMLRDLVQRLSYDDQLRPLFIKMLTKIVQEQMLRE